MNTESFHCRLVKPEDMNPAGTLFGGRVLEWLDEVAALYAMRVLLRDRIVTKKISEVNFLCPGRLGDYLEFYCHVKEVGTTSITITTQVYKRSVKGPMNPLRCPLMGNLLVSCEFVFVAVDEFGKSTPHGGISLDHCH